MLRDDEVIDDDAMTAHVVVQRSQVHSVSAKFNPFRPFTLTTYYIFATFSLAIFSTDFD